jgi:hypothetical protein
MTYAGAFDGAGAASGRRGTARMRSADGIVGRITSTGACRDGAESCRSPDSARGTALREGDGDRSTWGAAPV